MEDQKELVVGGYRFDRLSDASEAALEIEKATYFEQRISGRSPENMLAIYDKVLDERIFVTPVGWEYLKFLQARLKKELTQTGSARFHCTTPFISKRWTSRRIKALRERGFILLRRRK